MEFNCKVKIVDAIMGAGKSQSVINLINNSDEDDRFLVITSYLDEVKSRPAYGTAWADAACAGAVLWSARSGFQPVIRCSFFLPEESIVFDCETLILRAATVRAAGVLMQYRPAAAPNTTKRGVVSYRFRQI